MKKSQNSKSRIQKENAKSKTDLKKRLIMFSIEVIKFCSLLKSSKNFFVLSDQLLRSGTSIGANIIEAKGSGSKREYIHFFEIALRSANETKYWLLLVRETQFRHKQKADLLLQEAKELSKIISAGILTMKGKRNFDF